MPDKGLVSVVIIFLDARPYLRQAIDSVFTQTYRTWELLLVDDGSTDGSDALTREIAAQHPGRVRYLHHEGRANRGMSASRNLGAAHARGEQIALLDADDIWLPHKLESQVALLDAHPEAGMVYGPTRWWYSWTGESGDAARDFVHPLGVRAATLLPPPLLLERFLAQEGISPCTCSALIRREAWERAGGFEESFRGMYEDQAFFAKLCLRDSVYVSDDCSAWYRQHPASKSAAVTGDGAHAAARQIFLRWLAGYLEEQGVDDRRVQRAVDRQLRPFRYPRLHRWASAARSMALAAGRHASRLGKGASAVRE